MGTEEERYDVVVIGGGAAGLAGATTLGRARRSVLVVDAGEPRNAPADGVHNYLGREGTPPGELLAAGRAEAASYGVEVRDGEVVGAEREEDGGFRVDLAGGTGVRARRLLVTSGLTDELPDVDGLRGLWGRDVLHCPYCHGWEVRDRAIGVLSTGPMGAFQALHWSQWSADVTLLTHDGSEPSAEERAQLAARGVRVVDGKVTGAEAEEGRLAGVRLADGRTVPLEALVVTPRFTARAAFVDGLGLETAEQEGHGTVVGTHVPSVDPTGRTAVDGVWVAGNVANVLEQVVGSAAAGVKAAAAMNMDLIMEDTRRALAERETASEQEAWDARYASSTRLWSGRPNPVLVEETEGLEPGRALELGCGEGADAIWLAGRGWHVTGVDISAVALERAAAHARETGVADRVELQRHTLGETFPEGGYDLVATMFLHTWGEMPRERILREAAGAVVPGGVLVIAGHVGHPPHHPEMRLPTPAEVLADLGLPEDGGADWEVVRCEEFDTPVTLPDGQEDVRRNGVLTLRRAAA